MLIIVKVKFVSIVLVLIMLILLNFSFFCINVWNCCLWGIIINVSDNVLINGVRFGLFSMLLMRLFNKNIVMYIISFSLMFS